MKNDNGFNMIKIMISLLLLLSLNLSANYTEEGNAAYKDGNATQASKLYRKACKNGNMQGCTKLGVLYFIGDGLKQNHKKAKKLFVKACKKHYSKACYQLGTIYKRGADGIERDTRRSRMFYALTCKLGFMPGCDQYELIRVKPELKGSGKNVINSGYTYTTPEIYGG